MTIKWSSVLQYPVFVVRVESVSERMTVSIGGPKTAHSSTLVHLTASRPWPAALLSIRLKSNRIVGFRAVEWGGCRPLGEIDARHRNVANQSQPDIENACLLRAIRKARASRTGERGGANSACAVPSVANPVASPGSTSESQGNLRRSPQCGTGLSVRSAPDRRVLATRTIDHPTPVSPPIAARSPCRSGPTRPSSFYDFEKFRTGATPGCGGDGRGRAVQP